MTDSNEIEALKASLRGALAAGEALAALEARVLALDPRGALPLDTMDELGRVSLAHAVASQALRGLVESMRARRA